MFNNSSIANFSAAMMPEDPAMGAQNPMGDMPPGAAEDEGIDPGEALEAFLLMAESDQKAAQVISEFIQIVGEQRFDQLLEGGEWQDTELELLQQAATILAPGGKGQPEPQTPTDPMPPIPGPAY